jgi:pimeloyl-ACP methyl ester carboxylesterase
MTWVTMRDGVRLRVSARLAGESAEPPVVLVHGWKGSHRLWDRTVVELEARGVRVLSFDLRGMGESDKPDGVYDFDTYADDVRELLERFGLRDVTLVGWSMGCTVTLRHMERDGGRVGRVVLINGPLRLTQAPDFPHAMTQEQLDGYLAELTAGWPVSERAFQAESVLPGSDPAVIDWLLGIALQTPLPVVLSSVREQAKLDMRPTVRNLSVPVLAAYATGDPYYPTSLGQWIADAAPDGRLRVFEHSAHCTPFEEAVGLAEEIFSFGAVRVGR